MAQQKILKFFKEHQEELYTSREISKIMKITKGRVTGCIKQLRKYHFPILKLRRKTKTVLYTYCEEIKDGRFIQ